MKRANRLVQRALQLLQNPESLIEPPPFVPRKPTPPPDFTQIKRDGRLVNRMLEQQGHVVNWRILSSTHCVGRCENLGCKLVSEVFSDNKKRIKGGRPPKCKGVKLTNLQ